MPPGTIGGPPVYTPITQPESPLIPGQSTVLLENRWRIVEITHHNAPIAFNAIQPIYLTFISNGTLAVRAINCNAGGYYIDAIDHRHYRLVPGSITAMGCGEIGNKQESALHEALMATTEFELQGEQLILRGGGVKIVLVTDNN
ncbi:MAG: META domain-containing protein [Caldilineaceae bacterium]